MLFLFEKGVIICYNQKHTNIWYKMDTEEKIMPKFFVKQEQIKEGKIVILGQDVSHIKKVLRAKTGD